MTRNKMHRKAQAVERVLFAALVVALGLAGYVYAVFRDDLPQWQLVGFIGVGIFAAYGAYRLGLRFVRGNIGP